MKWCSREYSQDASQDYSTVGLAEVRGPSYRQCVQQCSLLSKSILIVSSGPVQRSCSVIMSTVSSELLQENLTTSTLNARLGKALEPSH